jgi:FHA domain-containing protein
MPEGQVPGVQVPSEALLVVSGRVQETLIPIPAGGLMLGRRARGAGRLGGDPALSRRHARIGRGPDGGWVIEDLRSANGTFVNGAQVSGPQAIAVGDVIFVGGTSLQVVDRDDAGDVTPTRTHATVAEESAPAAAEADAVAEQSPPAVQAAGPVAGGEGWRWWADEQASVPSPARPGAGPVPVAARGPEPAVTPRRWPGPAAPRWRQGRATVEGQVRGLQHRNEVYGQDSAKTVLTFRLERYDAAGNRLPPVPVQLRALAVEGVLSDNDTARVTGRWKDGTLHCEQVENLTTHSTVKARSYRAAVVVAVIVLVLMVGGFAFFLLRSTGSVEEDRDRAHEQFCRDSEELGVSPPGC